MSKSSQRVLVIGGGIVGISCALNAQRSGHRVTIMDPRGFAAGASYGNAGILAVSDCVPIGTPEILKQARALLFGKDSPLTMRWSYAPHMIDWLRRFALACKPAAVERATLALADILSRATQAHHELAQAAGVSDLIAQHGWIKAFETDAAFKAAAADFDRMHDHGVPCEVLDRDALLALEPNLAPIFRHAVLQPTCSQVVDPGRYVQALGDTFLKQGGTFIRAEVQCLQRGSGRVTAALTQTDRYDADVFVVAAGAWSKKLAADAGSRVPLDTERGYHVVLESPPEHMTKAPVLWAEHSIVMSPNTHGIRVTSSVEFAGLERGPDFSKLARKLPHVRRAYATAPGAVQAQWLGFRPSMPDSVPVIGKAPRAENTFFAFGHGHLGLTLGPITGRIIGALIDERLPEIDPAPYRASRF